MIAARMQACTMPVARLRGVSVQGHLGVDVGGGVNSGSMPQFYVGARAVVHVVHANLQLTPVTQNRGAALRAPLRWFITP